MSPSPQNILILSSNTGGGHRSAALALENSFHSLSAGKILVNITQVLEEAHLMSRHLANIYNYLLRHRQDLMKYYYSLINHLKPNESKWIIKGALDYGLQLMDKVAPDVIVSVHPMTQHLFSAVLKRLGLLQKIPIITVVTDPCYGFWKGWACQDVQQYYVASQDAGNQLIDYGIAQERIQVVGMPVHSRFQPITAQEQQAQKQAMGLDPDRFTVFLNAGWIGGGNIPQVYDVLRQSDLPIQILFLAGQNDDLQRQAQALAQTAQVPIQVLGYQDHLHKLMQASDLMVSKTGGLTTFEALATGLPIVVDAITPPMPQEKTTATFIEKTGSGLCLTRAEDIIPVLQGFFDSPHRYAMMRDSARQYGKPGAADQIAQQILEARF